MSNIYNTTGAHHWMCQWYYTKLICLTSIIQHHWKIPRFFHHFDLHGHYIHMDVFFCDYKSLWGSKLPRHCPPQWRPPFLSCHKLLLNCSPQEKPLLSLFGGWPYKRIGGGLLYFIYKFIGLIIRFNFVFLCPRDKESGGHINLPLSVRPDTDTWFVRLSPPTVLELQL